MWRLTILLIGCGRVGFDTGPSDSVSGDSPAGDAAMVSLADTMSCGQPVLLDAGNHLAHDTLVWAATPLGEWLVGVEHEDHDGAWIAWVDDSSGQQLRYDRLSGDGTLPRMSVGSASSTRRWATTTRCSGSDRARSRCGPT